MLDECGAVQWPMEEGRVCPKREGEAPAEPGAATELQRRARLGGSLALPHSSQRRLFEDGRFYHSDGRAKFLFEDPRPMPEPASKKFPFILLTGRGSASQWHTQTRTSKSDVLRKLYPESVYVEINGTDARRLGIGPGDRVIVLSQRGAITADAFITPAVQPGQLFIPMHYETVILLTDAVFDPYSKQPS